MKHPRFTVRLLMLAVALVALGLGYLTTRERAAIRLARSAYHAAEAEGYRRIVADWGKGEVRLINLTREQAEADVERFKRSAVHHDAMSRKWREAARYPWLPVEPDPPEPR
jgi:hypothetical protein